jgi:hypothetical protein
MPFAPPGGSQAAPLPRPAPDCALLPSTDQSARFAGQAMGLPFFALNSNWEVVANDDPRHLLGDEDVPIRLQRRWVV